MSGERGRIPRVSDKEFLETLEELTATNRNPVATTQEIADALPLARDSVYDRLVTFYDRDEVHKKKVGARGVVWWPVRETDN